MRAEDQFHVGIVVDDFEAAQADLSSLLGYEWSAELRGPIEVRRPGGVPLFAFYRAATGFRVELVSRVAQPGLERHWAGLPQNA